MRPAARAVLEHTYVFQRTPSAIGWRGNHPTEPDFVEHLSPGWQKERTDNFSAVMIGKPVEVDLVDDAWTEYMARVANFTAAPEMSPGDATLAAEAFDYSVMEQHRARVEELVHDPTVAEALKPYYRYLCKRPLFHDEYLAAFNEPNVTLVDCPAGIERVTSGGLVANGQEFEVDCIVYATGFEAEVTPFPRRAAHEIIGRDGVSIADKWKDGPCTLHGIMSRGFPNFFIIPAPGQQAVITREHHPPLHRRRDPHRRDDCRGRSARRDACRRERGGRDRLVAANRGRLEGQPRVHGRVHPVPRLTSKVIRRPRTRNPEPMAAATATSSRIGSCSQPGAEPDPSPAWRSRDRA